MHDVGIVPLDASGGYWPGGQYYLQHLIRCNASLLPDQRVAFTDLYWLHAAERDPFARVRPLIDHQRVLQFPSGRLARAARKLRRSIRGIADARDLFGGIDVTFPLPLIEAQGVPSLFWLPDLQHEHLRALYQPEHYAKIVALYTKYLDGAARIVVSSQFGLEDLARFYPAHATRADVLRFCSVPDDDWWRLDPATYTQAIGLDGPFFVVSNQFTEHKNHLLVVEAVAILRDRGVRAVVACTGSDYDFRGARYIDRVRERVRELGLDAQIRFLGLLPRDEQLAVTRRAVAALQPSRFEGWSTVIEDAKSLGKFVIASEFPVHREQLAGRPARFAGMDDPAGWADALEATLRERAPGPHAEDEAAARAWVAEAMRTCGATFAAIVAKTVDAAKR
ncbi:MAG: glycosyltransferase [Acidobacteria bacterium]|nr:glycosyltransferase [Acidobacteriota bacterium]MBV9477491.1 glycosyltransferase [Acidobacteriota bacterium]